MPIMEAQNEHSSNYSSPTSGAYYSNANSYSSPDSPTSSLSRKRKQEYNFTDLNNQSNNEVVLNNLYYQPTWNKSTHPDEFIVPNTSGSSSTAFQQNDMFQKSTVMDNTWQRSSPSADSFLVSNDGYNDSFLNNGQKTVGENNTEIHQLLNLDQPLSFVDSSKGTRNLHLSDSRLMQEPWSPQNQQSFSNGASSPGFFTPGFLESLQEDEHESLRSYPFHVPAKNWNLDEQRSTIEHDKNMTSEKAFVPQQQQQDIPNTLFHSGPSSPIPSSSSSCSPPTFGNKFVMAPLLEDAMLEHRRTLHTGVMNARLLNQSEHAIRMKPIIQNYLAGRGDERTVVIMTSKVAQKSYGTEKRFLCPPPTAILVGTSWWTKSNGQRIENTNEVLKKGQEELNPPKLTVNISGETTTPQSGQIEWYTVSGVAVGQTGHNKSQQQPTQSNLHQSEHPSRFRSSSESRSNSIDWYHNLHNETLSAGKCVSKHLYINDADEKRKRVECMIKIQLANGLPLGTLVSKGIKVISKPSKKRQSVKNMELCIHHGTTVSLFNRIRSQTVSTKYLGVSTPGSRFSFPGQNKSDSAPVGEGTCFVARTSCWDPFVIWAVDLTRTPGDAKETDTPEDFIGRNSSYIRNISYPPPPAIALKNKTGQLIPIHYNQHVVLQCLTTGLVSPVMIIRKVDKASTVVGGAQSTDDLKLLGGGEFGDEVPGDPVSQLHKVALQIVQDPLNTNHRQSQQDYYQTPSLNMMPRTIHPVTYLACLNDMVGMHKTTEPRKPIHTPTPLPTSSTSSNSTMNWDASDLFDVTALEEKVIRKRRVSTNGPPSSISDHNMMMMMQKKYSLNTSDELYSTSTIPPLPMAAQSAQKFELSRKSSVSSTSSTGRRSSAGSINNQSLGAFWNEDVSDAAVWTIVGTDCATYTFSSPTYSLYPDDANSPIIPNAFPTLTSFTAKPSKDEEFTLSMHGENFSRDIQVWFGDKKAIQTDYRSRELLICKVPSKADLLETKNAYNNEIPILLVRGDGTICKTHQFYPL